MTLNLCTCARPIAHCSFMEDKLRQKDATADKLRLKNTTTKALITKLEHQLAHKEEMGEVGGICLGKNIKFTQVED